MKNVLLSVFFSFVFLSLSAQITFTADDLPGIGDKIVLANDTITQDISPGPSGANQTWDFSQLSADDTLSLDFVDPAGTQYFDQFPSSTIAVEQSNATIYAQTTSDAFLFLGTALDTFPQFGLPVQLRNVPPQIVYQLPTTSTTSFTQAYSNTVTADGSIFEPGLDSVRIVIENQDTVMVDGYGTLITPEGTFQSLRLHTRSATTTTLSFKVFGVWQEVGPPATSYAEQYDWIAKETGGIAFSISYDEDGSVLDIEWWLDPATAVAPNAEFTFQDNGGGQVEFNDLSFNNPTSWLWNFGDGNTSTQQNPTHTYVSDGIYTVCLTASNENGSDQTCQQVNVVISSAPVADFIYQDMGGGLLNFTDVSTNNPTSWLWGFGDGSTSTEQNPSHTFAATGTYTVCLTATNSAGSDQTCQEVMTAVVAAPAAGFTFEDQGQGAFAFTDASTNDPTSWLWDFGDGNTSTMQNPSHTFAATGSYTVCLTATNSAGSDQTCQEVMTMVVVAPAAGFTFEDQGQGAFAFTDASTNDPTSWLWDFGDGNTSTMQNPSHTFGATGSYTVCLTATNSAGSDEICQEVAVVVTSTYALEREYGFRLYPNPASTGIQLEFKLTGRQPLLIRFHNALGQQVHATQLNGDHYIDMQAWPVGTYFFSVSSEKGELLGSGKLLKE
jgi:PKD repeat protein